MHFVNVISKVNNKLNHTTAEWYSFYILVRKFAHSVEYLVMGVRVKLLLPCVGKETSISFGCSILCSCVDM